MERAAAGLTVARSRLGQCLLAVDIGPGVDGGIALGDPGKAVLDQGLGRGIPGFKKLCRVESGQLV
jgi:hypothetical protein